MLSKFRPKKIGRLTLCAAMLASCATGPRGEDRVSASLATRTGHRLTTSAPGQTVMPRGVSLANGLSEHEAVAIALCNNAAFLETLTDLGISRAEIVQAGVIPNPTLSLLFPSGQKQLEFTAKLASEVLWLRPLRLKAAKLDYERTAELLVQNGLNLIRDAKLAFAETLAAGQRLKLAEESASLSAKIETLAKARVTAGDVSELEIGTVGIDTLQGEEIAERARQDVAIARERLRGVLGLGLDPTAINVTSSEPPPRVRQSSTELVKIALASRPDLRAAEIGIEAAGARHGIAQGEIFALTAILDGNQTDIATDGGRGSRTHIEVGAGLDAAIPVFNQNQGGRAKAKAQVAKAARHYITVRDRIVGEVREARLRCLQAQASYENWHDRILPPLEQAVRQSQQAYETGDVALFIVLESSRKLSDARARKAAAAVDLRRATAELERAIGGRLPR